MKRTTQRLAPKNRLLMAGITAILLLPVRGLQAQSAPAPNIVLIMLDDMDVSDVGVYGSSDVVTETIDTIAERGIRFENYYANAPVCSPTRIAMLTGQYPTRFGVHRAILSTSMRGIPDAVVTLPEALKEAGYLTGHVGKWHVGTAREEFLPTQMGFDSSVRVVPETGYYGYNSFKLSIDDDTTITSNDGDHLTEVLTDHALEFLAQASRSPETPFFLNLWYFAPHDPLEPPRDFDNSDTDYCLEEMANGCHVDRGRLAALVTNADRQIKRIVEYLADSGAEESTVLIVTSDNGGAWRTHSPAAVDARQVRGYKEHVYDGGIRVPLLVRWPGVVQEAGLDRSVLMSFDLYPTLVEIAGLNSSSFELDGNSFLQQMTGDVRDVARNETLFWENKAANVAFESESGIYNSFAARRGDWKLVYVPARRSGQIESVELFDLSTDPLESDPVNFGRSRRSRTRRMLGIDVYRVTSRSGSPGGRTGDYSNVVNSLKEDYFSWRWETGVVSLDFDTTADETGFFAFDGGVVRAVGDTRIAFSDYDFSFLTRIETHDVESRGTIAVLPGVWDLSVDSGNLNLEVRGVVDADTTSRVARISAPLSADSAHSVGFTVFGWRDSPSEIRLYLDGVSVARVVGNRSIDRALAPTTHDFTIYLGNSPDLTSPFYGRLSVPKASVLALYPAEVMRYHALDARLPRHASDSRRPYSTDQVFVIQVGRTVLLAYVLTGLAAVGICVLFAFFCLRNRKRASD